MISAAGYSSLSLSRNLAFNELKIDKSLPLSALQADSSDPLVESIIHIGKQLGV